MNRSDGWSSMRIDGATNPAPNVESRAAPSGGPVFLNPEEMPHTCFIDESGDRYGLHSPGRLLEGQPVYVVLGLVVSDASLAQITPEFLRVREGFAPGESEAKGSDLRRDLKQPLADDSRAAGFVALKAALRLLDRANARVTGRVCVKRAGERFDGAGAEVRALRFVAGNFSRFLRRKNAEGRIVFDSRGDPRASGENKQVVRAMRRPPGRAWSKLRHPPIFAHSKDSVGLQLADWICSALIAPPAATAYCGDCARLRGSPHIHENYLQMRDQHGGGDWLWRRQLRFQAGGKTRWGLEVEDPRERSSELLFRASAGG